ncbi:MAG: VOC family protein [Patescibacteria group bacterium]
MAVSNARFAHVNLVARDWRALAEFYTRVFGCLPVPPERDLRGEALEEGTGLPGAHLRGMHLRLPGFGGDGPTLEIFQYDALAARPDTAVNRPGYGHLAFRVDDVPAACAAVIAAGGRRIGRMVTTEVGDGARVTWAYLVDPEGNILELQSYLASG